METGGITGADAHDQFLNLLVIQLRQQDPLDPVKQEDFLQQLAQFSTLEQIEALNGTVEQQVSLQQDLLLSQQVSQAAAFVGQTVVYANGDGKTVSGNVDSVQLQEDGMQLRIGTERIFAHQVLEIGEPSIGIEDNTADVSDD